MLYTIQELEELLSLLPPGESYDRIADEIDRRKALLPDEWRWEDEGGHIIPDES